RTPRQHQRPHHHGRREGGRPDQEQPMTTDVTPQVQDAEATARETFDSLNPVTGDVVGTHPVRTAEEVREAVDRAREAAGWWASLSYDERADLLTTWTGVITRPIAPLARVA